MVGVSGPYHYAMGEQPAPVCDLLPTPFAGAECPQDVTVDACLFISGPDFPDQEADPALEDFGDPAHAECLADDIRLL